MPHLISIGRLDLMSEGLILLTNDGDLANALEHPSSQIERAYRVRVFGRMFNEAKLLKIQKGMIIGSQFYGPYIAEVEKRQNTNTWLYMKLYQGKNREIRKVMEKLSLRVNRLQRVKYGPYSIKQVPLPNDLRQVPIKRSVRKLVQRYYGGRLKEAQNELAHVGAKKIKNEFEELSQKKQIQSEDGNKPWLE